ncbi:T9SS type A sorting domain-containing protein [Polluticaenibacter yanchengensis]|uniref:T9SS type A sorting domain-containing protein n=1 Tax=Polluticaenibacter yanchengensis TaxID=3014562 RepID=A0ABT4UJ86_9BACT|nr:T9SS type A sorting domain-containing protein [Chitinophagaceae bacterium LY-5]
MNTFNLKRWRTIVSCLLLLFCSSARIMAQNCSINAGAAQAICVGSPFTLSGAIGGPFNSSTVTWSVVSQPAGANVVITTPKSLNTTAGISTVTGTYVFRLSGTCGDNIPASNNVTIVVNPVPAVPSQSGSTTYSCYTGGPVSLIGSAVPAGSTARWQINSGLSGVFSTPNATSTTFTPTIPPYQCAAYFPVEIAYVITNASGCSQSSVKTYYFYPQYTFFAVADPVVACGTQTLLKGSCAGNGTGLWTVISRPSGAPVPVIANTGAAQTVASNLVPGNYVFNYAVTGTCGNNNANVSVTVASGTTVTRADAGKDQHHCTMPGTISLTGNSPAANESVTWSLLSGGTTVNIANPSKSNTTVTGLTSAGAPYSFLYQVSTPGGCFTKDTVIVFEEPKLSFSSFSGSTCDASFLPYSTHQLGVNPMMAIFGNYSYNQLDSVTVNITYISGPSATIINQMGFKTSGYPYTVFGTDNGYFVDDTLALGMTSTKKYGPGSLYPYAPPALDAHTYNMLYSGSFSAVGTYRMKVSYTTRCSTYVSDLTFNRGVTLSVNAGSDVYLNCGATTATLAGNIMDDFATWQTVSMPAGATDPVNTSNFNKRFANLTGLINGTYIFRYSNNAGTNCVQRSDDVKIIVSSNPPATPNAGADRTACAGSLTLSGSAVPTNALAQWSVISPAGAAVSFSDATLSTPVVSGLLPNTTYTFRYRLTNGCGTSYDDVIITTNSSTGPSKPAISITGGDCSAQSLSAFPGTVSQTVTHPALTGTNSGNLSVVAVPASALTGWTQTASTTTTKTVQLNLSSSAAVSFIWCESGSACATQTMCDTVTKYFLLNTTSISAGNNQTICDISSFPYTITLTGTATPITKNWSLVYSSNGLGVNLGSAASNITSAVLPASGTYRFKYELIGPDPVCQTMVSYVTIIASEAGSFAYAGEDMNVCNNSGTFNLAATPLTSGTGRWTVEQVVSGSAPSISNSSSATSSVTFSQSGQVVLRWSSYGSNPVCGMSSSDLVTVTYIAPANAGNDISLCNNTSANLSAVNPSPGTGTWMQVSGPNTATIANPANPNSLISNLVNGNYIFRWQVQNGAACITNDDVIISIKNMAEAADAGNDFTFCNGSTNRTIVLNARTPSAGITGSWSLYNRPSGAAAGTFTNGNSPAAVYNNASVTGKYVFAWTITNGTCSSTDFVEVELNNTSCINISGTVFNDENANTIIDGAETGTTAGTNLFVYMVNNRGVIIDSAKVAGNGTYTLNAVPNNSYTLYLSRLIYSIGTSPAIDTDLPGDWINTGENNSGNNTGLGDGSPDGMLLIMINGSSFSNANFGIVRSSVLPVSLTVFSVYKQQAHAKLTWTTATENGNKGFEIERRNHADWSVIGFVTSKAPNGISNTAINYDFIDRDPNAGINQYRIKQIDENGKISYSHIRALNFESQSAISVFPNPGSGKFTIQGLTGNENIKIYNASGQIVWTGNNKNTVLKINLEHLSNGVYKLEVSDGEQQRIYKIIIAR